MLVYSHNIILTSSLNQGSLFLILIMYLWQEYIVGRCKRSPSNRLIKFVGISCTIVHSPCVRERDLQKTRVNSCNSLQRYSDALTVGNLALDLACSVLDLANSDANLAFCDRTSF